jgi:EAL and modified HD-GYP domain-containing signal transduction protein
LPSINCCFNIERTQTLKKPMAAPESPLPLVEMHAAANAGNRWVALTLRIAADAPDPGAAWQAVFATPALLNALGPLDCVLLLPTPAILTPALLALLPSNRVMFAIAADALPDAAARRAMAALQEEGYRILIDGPAPAGVALPPGLGAVSRDCTDGVAPGALLSLYGPHLARGVNSGARRDACAAAGFGWFSGEYALHPTHPIHPARSGNPGNPGDRDDGSSRKRLLSLLGLLAVDADTGDIETLIKQDPALSHHLIKLVNSAAFASSTPIANFHQAIGRLGRRQLQRWVQLLLYARQAEDGLPNLLLPLAATRAARMESLVGQRGGDREAQDAAFTIGVFSLLDVLLGIPMEQIAAALKLAPDHAGALLGRRGELGRLLALVETPAPTPADLQAAGIAPRHWWQSQLHACHWAIQVSRSV